MGFIPDKQFKLFAVGNKLEINPNNFQSSALRIVVIAEIQKNLNTVFHPFTLKI